AFIPLGFNNNTDDDTFCVLDAAAQYVGFTRQGQGFKVYDRTAGTFLSLPNKPFDSRMSSFSAPFIPPRGGVSGPGSLGTPVVSRFRMLRRRFVVTRRRTAKVARRRVRRGSAFLYSLSEDATV